MYKTILFVISDDYYNNDKYLNLVKGKIMKGSNRMIKYSKMKLSYFNSTYGYLSVPFTTNLIVFIIHENEKQECENIVDNHFISLAREIDYYFIKNEQEDDKVMQNKIDTIDLKKGMDDIIDSLNALNAIDDECHVNKTTMQYFNKACEYVKTAGVGDKYVYLHTMKLMASQINNLENLLTVYTRELKESQQLKPLKIVDYEDTKELQKENERLKLENEELNKRISQVVELIRGGLNG